MRIFDIVKNNVATFDHYCGGNLYYNIKYNGGTYQFSITTDNREVGTASFENKMKVIHLMRWIRKSIEKNEFVKIK